MTQRESKLSRRIVKALNAAGYFAFKVHGSEYMMAGLPDIIVCVEGKFLGLEVKLPESRGNVSPAQRYVHHLIQQSMGKVEVVCSVSESLHVAESLISPSRSQNDPE